MNFPEVWTLIRAGADQVDPATGNMLKPSTDEVQWRGLLQQRLMVDPWQREHVGDDVAAQMVLLLKPGITVGPRALFRFDGPVGVSDLVGLGDVVAVQGTTRARRPVRGSRRAAYIAAIVRHVSSMRELA